MTNVKLTTKLAGNDAGTTINVTPGSAAQLIRNGYAEPIEQPAPKTRAKTKAKGTAEAADSTEGGGASPSEPPSTAG